MSWWQAIKIVAKRPQINTKLDDLLWKTLIVASLWFPLIHHWSD